MMEPHKIHRLMLGHGFSFKLARQLPDNAFINKSSRTQGYYVKDYATEAGSISVALLLSDDLVINLPAAVILTLPEQLKGILIPHVSTEGYLCYVEQREANWDPNNPDNLYSQVDEKIQTTLQKAVFAAVRGEFDDAELEGEFSSYWRSSCDLYTLSAIGIKSSLKSRMCSFTDTDGVEGREFICFSDGNSVKDEVETVVSKWINQREIKLENVSENIPTHCVRVNPERLAGINWPPASMRDVLKWLEKVDHNARNKTVEKIVLSKKRKQLVIFDVQNHDLLGIYLEFDLKAINFNRYSQRGRGNFKVNDLVSLLSSDRVSKKYYRISVEKADVESMFSRNLVREKKIPLNELRIAIVGCGTIGGYLSELLLQSGAGCGKSQLHLYDSDTYRPHNFSRHILPAKYFGHSKSLSLAEVLTDSMHFATNVKGYKKDFILDNSNLSKYHIIIDATGRSPIAKRLAMLKCNLNSAPAPLIVHAFNDGNGRASKVFIDDGSCCYGCLMSDKKRYQDDIDLRFKDKGFENEKKRSCGSTYTPYDAAVSHVTASLAQEALLNHLSGKKNFNYYEHMFDGSKTLRPRKVSKNEKCEICSRNE